MTALTIESARAALGYNPVTGLFVRLASPGINPKVRVGGIAGSPASNGYRRIGVGNARYLAHRLAWFMTYGQWPNGELDHINGDKTDNRIENLRVVSRSQNMANAPRQANNRSGHKGVHLDRKTGRWMAYMSVDGKFKNLGRYDFIDAAVAARAAAFHATFGEHARA